MLQTPVPVAMSAIGVLFIIGCRTAAKPSVEEDSASPAASDDADGDGYTAAEDCDDANAATHPGAFEVCDGVDNDCDAEIDEGVLDRWYADTDGDGYGDPSAARETCDAPEGHVPTATDCDDTDPATFPGAPERCDGKDNDCDTEIDEGIGARWYRDADGDGYGVEDDIAESCTQPSGYVDNAEDCDDANSSSSPAAVEVCDGLDNNCDGQTDESGAEGAQEWNLDSDGDGYGDPSGSLQACTRPSNAVANADDCDDTDPEISPAATEICDTLDNNCDGLIDDADPGLDTTTTTAHWTDSDGDGYGEPASESSTCDVPSGAVTMGGDCDDADPLTYPSAPEQCNGTDDSCDGVVDEGLLGTGVSCPASSCGAVLADDPSASDDAYWLEPGTTGSVFEAWCDMTSDGGGWTLVASVVNDGSRQWDSLAVWTDATTFGSYATAQLSDLKSPAFQSVVGDDLLVRTAGYDMSFHSVLGAWSFADFITTEYDSSTCSQSYLADGADWSSGLSADQRSAQNLIIRPLDDNASCFPNANEQVIVGFQSASCCWVGGAGNTPGGQATWSTHDGSFITPSNMATTSCTAGVYPCNANGLALTYDSFCYGTSCKEQWAELYVR